MGKDVALAGITHKMDFKLWSRRYEFVAKTKGERFKVLLDLARHGSRTHHDHSRAQPRGGSATHGAAPIWQVSYEHRHGNRSTFQCRQRGEGSSGSSPRSVARKRGKDEADGVFRESVRETSKIPVPSSLGPPSLCGRGAATGPETQTTQALRRTHDERPKRPRPRHARVA